MKKLAVLFPGMGYTCMKPLLYYANELCFWMGYETIKLDYGEIPHDKERAFPLAYDRVMPQVLSLPYEEYDDVVFISKSMGTVLAAMACSRLDFPIRNVFMTPVMDTTGYMKENGIALSGMSDPWAPDHRALKEACKAHSVPLYSFQSANHSLEVDSVQKNLDNMKRVMEIIEDYLRNVSVREH